MNETNSEKIYQTAKRLIGTRQSAGNPEFGCAITVNNIVQAAIGLPIGGGYSTARMYECLKDGLGTRFLQVPLGEHKPGNIIISPTGQGNGDLPNGHVGIITKNDPNGILSNDSASGELHQYWNVPKWRQFYGQIGGYPIYIFEVL